MWSWSDWFCGRLVHVSACGLLVCSGLIVCAVERRENQVCACGLCVCSGLCVCVVCLCVWFVCACLCMVCLCVHVCGELRSVCVVCLGLWSGGRICVQSVV